MDHFVYSKKFCAYFDFYLKKLCISHATTASIIKIEGIEGWQWEWGRVQMGKGRRRVVAATAIGKEWFDFFNLNIFYYKNYINQIMILIKYIL